MSDLTRILIEEIRNAPDSVQRLVYDYLVFLKWRRSGGQEGQNDLLPLAQSAWAADWNTVEEDEVWRRL